MVSIHDFEPLWGSWKIDRQLGRGSYGGVYLAYREDSPDFRSAVKHVSIPADEAELRMLMSEGIAADLESARSYYEKFKDDLISEIRFMYRLRGCPNIVAYEDHAVIGKKDMPGYDILIRMELLEPLTERAASKPFSQGEVCRLGIDICTALEALERERIIHRDIKPANILMSRDGTYKLGDFGVARQMEKTSMVLSKKGTYSYMAPEVYRGEEAGKTADLYSLGLVMHRLLNANRAPFLPPEGEITYQDTELALAKRLAGKELPRPAYADDAVAAVIGRACAFKPAERYAAASDMKAALQRGLERGVPGAGEPDGAERAMPWEARSMSDAASSSGTGRDERIRTIQDGDAELAASLKRKYAYRTKRENKEYVITLIILISITVAALAIIWVLSKMIFH
ncbi:MAG TPA: serine/threonine-protein kinase [Clostridia bacterium]|nr:MAG: Serine/threonine-protein kinase StkP [Firmicutes bacterium ADurb.Bin248]HOG00703.1 serine/threonine-protein kinase [Clostridia bacterium]HOS19349.1 serine/threonine-protein kinase [Clostridia bacterium]HPK16695.1 serine/threonine-protein kinase [Clostridia bacterium]